MEAKDILAVHMAYTPIPKSLFSPSTEVILFKFFLIKSYVKNNFNAVTYYTF